MWGTPGQGGWLPLAAAMPRFRRLGFCLIPPSCSTASCASSPRHCLLLAERLNTPTDVVVKGRSRRRLWFVEPLLGVLPSAEPQSWGKPRLSPCCHVPAFTSPHIIRSHEFLPRTMASGVISPCYPAPALSKLICEPANSANFALPLLAQMEYYSETLPGQGMPEKMSEDAASSGNA